MEFWKTALARVENGLTAFLLALMTGLVFVAVVLRYVFNSPIGWSDEVAKISFTWLIFLGGAIGVRRGAHIGIDAVVVFLPAAARRGVAFVGNVLVLVVLGVFVYYGILLAAMTASVTTPSLGISVAFVYAAAPLGAFLMLLHQVGHIASTWFGWGTPGAEAREKGR
jgi:TRAP-type C4-dicarboxylate transport system permease small subunit